MNTQKFQNPGRRRVEIGGAASLVHPRPLKEQKIFTEKLGPVLYPPLVSDTFRTKGYNRRISLGGESYFAISCLETNIYGDACSRGRPRFERSKDQPIKGAASQRNLN
jgi:hypothetical protein